MKKNQQEMEKHFPKIKPSVSSLLPAAEPNVLSIEEALCDFFLHYYYIENNGLFVLGRSTGAESQDTIV